MTTYLSPLNNDEINKINLADDLFLLGGPFHNSLTRLFFGLTKDKQNIPFYFDTFEGEEATLFYKSYNDIEYKKVKPIKDPIGNYYCEDYGLIINIRNPYDSNKRIIALMGCRSIGVLGATLAFTNFNKKIMNDIKFDEYAVIVKCFGDQTDVNLSKEIKKVDCIELKSITIEDLNKLVNQESVNV